MDADYEMIATPPKKITSEEVPKTKIDAGETTSVLARTIPTTRTTTSRGNKPIRNRR